MSSGADANRGRQEYPELYGASGRYYRMLLQNNYITDLSASKNHLNSYLQMEHSYSRDWRPLEGAHIMTTRTIMVHRPPQCPSCHTHSHDEGVDMNESYNPPIPSYNEEAARTAMADSERIAAIVRPGINQDSDHDWEDTLNKIMWTRQQEQLFAEVSRILDLDHLARLANAGRLHEPVLRRVVIDKSVSRLRRALARHMWEPKITQWLHSVLMDHLPPTYMAAYLDILQTLKSKMPALVDKMMLLRPVSSQPDLLAPVLKAAWEPCVAHKSRKLPGHAIIVIVPSSPSMNAPSSRLQRWYTLLATMANVVPIQVNLHVGSVEKQSVQSITEHMIAISRAKIQEIRNEVANRHIILVGFNAGAALALQVALVEPVNSVVCMGFAYNTANGVRGSPDDRILDLTTPVMFVLGQNSARSSQEEVESLRERMQAQTSLVVVGSADDALRVGKTKRQIEGVTQAMVDNMIIDEVSEFTSTCIINPPAPRDLTAESAVHVKLTNGPASKAVAIAASTTKKRKGSEHIDGIENAFPKPKASKMTVARPRNLAPPLPKVTPKSLAQQPTSEALNMAIQSILPAAPSSAATRNSLPNASGGEIITTFEVLPNNDLKPIPVQSSSVFITSKSNIPPPPQHILQARTMQKIKVMPSNQFVKIKPPGPNTQQMYTVKSNHPAAPTKPSPMYTIRTQTTPIISTSADANRMHKVFTVKSTPTGTQLLSTTPNQHTTAIKSHVNIVKQHVAGSPLNSSPSPKKFTIVKQQSPQIMKLNQQHHKPAADLSSANIFDIPIVFADNDGNIQDHSATTTSGTTATSSPASIHLAAQHHHLPNTLGSVVISAHSAASANPLQNRNIIINTIANKSTTGGGNKVVLINRPIKGNQIQIGGSMSHMTMLPANSIVTAAGGASSGGTSMQKFTKVNVSNASSISLPIRTNIEVRPTTMANFKPGTFTLGNKVEIINNQIVKSSTNMSPMRQTSGFTNLAGGLSTPTNTTTTTNIAGASPTTANNGGAKYNPIVINVDSDKTTIKNIIKVGDTQIKPTNTIVIKPGGLRPMLKPGILNRNVTVRKVVNLVQQQHQSPSSSTAATTKSSSGMTVSLQPHTPVVVGTQIVLQASQLQPLPTAAAAAAASATTPSTPNAKTE